MYPFPLVAESGNYEFDVGTVVRVYSIEVPIHSDIVP